MAGKCGVTYESLLDRLANQFTVGDDCWEWIGKLNDKGYGRIHSTTERRSVPAHRVLYELLVGPIPKGLVLDHLCRNRACVRPSHLEPVTNAENIRRGLKKTHCKRGHELAGSNLYIYPNGDRECRACRPARALERA